MIWPRRRRPAPSRNRRPQVFDRALESLEPRVVPAVVTWTGAGSSARWSDAANWADNDGPDPGDDLVFPATTTRTGTFDDFADLSVNSITVNGPYDLEGTAFVRLTVAPSGSLPTGIFVGVNGQVVRLTMPELRFGGAGTLAVPTSSDLSLNVTGGTVTGPGALQMTGGGRVGLGGIQTGSYTGAIAVGQGLLRQYGSSVLRSLSLARGTTFDLNGSGSAVGSLAGDGANLTLGAANLAITGDSSTVGFSGEINGTGRITVREGASLALVSGIKRGVSEITVRGSLTLGGGVGSNFYSTGSYVNLVADGATTGRLDVAAGAEGWIGGLSGGGDVAGPGGTPGLPANSLLAVSTFFGDATFAGSIVGSGRVESFGFGVWTLSSDLPGTFTGSMLVRSGSLVLEGDAYADTPVGVEGGNLSGTRVGSVRSAGNGPAVVSPGLDGIGTLEVGGAVEFYPSLTMAIDVAGTGPGQYDRLVAPEATVSPSTRVFSIRLRDGYAPTLGARFPVIEAKSFVQFTGYVVRSDGYEYEAEVSGNTLAFVVTKVPTRTTLATSPGGYTTGEPVILTATVAPTVGSAAPTGLVWFRLGSTYVGSAPLVDGVATFDAGRLAAGDYDVAAEFNGSTSTTGSQAQTRITVLPVAGVSLTSSPNPTAFGQTAYFYAAITPSTPGGPTPTGTVEFVVNGIQRAVVQMVNGVATYFRSNFSVGTIRVEAFYSGDGVYAAARVPAALDQVVNRATVAVQVAANPNPTTLGQPVTLGATIVPDSGRGFTPLTGRVRFRVGATELGVVDVKNDVALLTTDRLPVGRSEVVADYLGDNQFQPGTSAVAAVPVVNPGSVFVNLGSSAGLIRLGESLTLVASARPLEPASAPLSGRITFRAGPLLLGSFPVVDGLAQVTTTALPVGSYPITAEYGEDPSYASATGLLFPQLVVAPGLTTVAVASTKPQALPDEAVTLVAAVDAQVPGAGPPTGSVVFAAGSVVLGTAPVVDGVARFTTATLANGRYDVTATYQGDANFAPSASATLAQVVSPPALVGLTASTATAASGQVVTFVATAQAPARGTVLFVDGIQVIGVVDLADGRASLAVPLVGAGWTHTITARVLDTTSDPLLASVAVVRAETRSDVAVAPVRNRAGRVTGFSVTGTVAVAAPGAGTPTGSVTILVNGRVYRTVPLVNGQATQVIRLADALNRRVRVRYEGDADRAGSLSPTVVARRTPALPAPGRPGKIRNSSEG